MIVLQALYSPISSDVVKISIQLIKQTLV